MTKYATLPPGHVPMTDEEWETNKVCELAKRAHKWRWKTDIATGLPSMTEAICAHCGMQTKLGRDYSEQGS